MNENEQSQIQRRFKQIEIALLEIFKIISIVLSEDEKDYLLSLITHGEGGIAFEDIIAIIRSRQVNITNVDYDKIQHAGQLMEFPAEVWSFLNEYIK